jgi:hypothetical protein
MKTKNVWINANERQITRIQRGLVEKSYAGQEAGELNVMEINNIIGNCLIEITRLQTEVDDLKILIQAKPDTPTEKK